MVDEVVGGNEQVLRELRHIREELSHLREELSGVKRTITTGLSTIARTVVETHLQALANRRV